MRRMSTIPSPADYATLVDLAEQRGLDPLGIAAMFFWESGFNPANPGPPSADPPVGGLNQMNEPNINGLGLTRAQWLGMSVAQQLGWIFHWWDGLAAHIPYPADAAALYALNFLPARYKERALTSRDAPLTSAGEGWYESNTTLDPDHTGAITVNTIARHLAKVAASTNSRWQMIRQGVLAAYEAGPAPASAFAPNGWATRAVELVGAVAVGVGAIAAFQHFQRAPVRGARARFV